MAYEVTTKKNVDLGDRIGGALKAVGNAVGQGIDYKLQLDQAERQRQQFELQQKQVQAQMEQAQLQFKDLATNKIGEKYSNLATLNPDQVESGFNQQEPAIIAYKQALGQSYNRDAELARVKDLNKLVGGENGLMSRFNTAYATLASANDPFGKDPKTQEAAMIAKSTYGQMVRLAPSLADTLKAQKAGLDDFQLQRLKGAQGMAEAQAKATQKAVETATQPTVFDKELDKKQAQEYQTQLSQLPQLKTRTKVLDDATKLIGKVFTGPLAGKSFAYGMQKISSNDAQKLEYLLSQENVQKIMEFAKSAGVRSIDTEAEQQRLLQAIANKEQSPAVMRQALESMRNVISETQKLIKAKQQYYAKNGNLRGFDPSSLGEAVDTSSVKPAPQQQLGPDEVLKYTKDGKGVIVNSKTGKSIRWAQ